MPEINQKQTDFYAAARPILAKMQERGDFALDDDSEAARSMFEGCALNCGMLMFMGSYGWCTGERVKARQQKLICSTDTIISNVDTKQNIAATFKTILANNNVWILTAMQAHRTRVNFDNLSKFCEESWKIGVARFKAEDN